MKPEDLNPVYPQTKYDPVNNPQHYAKHQPEHIDIVKDWGLAYDTYMQTILKYLARYRYKDNSIEDLEKALWWAEARLEDKNCPGNGLRNEGTILSKFTPYQVAKAWEECPAVHRILLNIYRWMGSGNMAYAEEIIIDLKTYISQYKLLKSMKLGDLKDES